MKQEIKQLLFVLLLVCIVSGVAFCYLGSNLTEWTNKRQDTLRSLIVFIVAVVICPRPVAYILVFVTKLFFPDTHNQIKI